MKRKIINGLAQRGKVLHGSFLALLFLIVESVGLLLLTRFLTEHQGISLAGRTSLILYIVMLANIFFSSLGVIISREIAANWGSGAAVARLAETWHWISALETMVVCAGFAIFLVALTINQFVLRNPVIPPDLGVLFYSGFLLRGIGLLSAFKRVGTGDLGADKAFTLLFSIIFYVLAVGSVQFRVFDHSSVGIAYAIAGIVSYALERRQPLSIAMAHSMRSHKHTPIALRSRSPLKPNLMAQYVSFLTTSVAGFCVTNGDAFVVSFVFGNEALASYAIASKLSLGIFAVAAIYPSMQFQPLTRQFSENNISACRKLWLEGALVALAVAIATSVAVTLLYPIIVRWVTAEHVFLGKQLFLCLCVSATLMSLTAANGWAIMGGGGASLLAAPTLVDAVLTITLGFAGAYAHGILGLLLGIILAHAVSTSLHGYIAAKLFRT